MEIFKIENLTFTYPEQETAALKDVSLSINQGEFVTVCGKSGCGKSTLLRQLKPSISPFGTKSGAIYFEGKNISELELREQSESIGFVMQSPDNQIVTDKVWHELAFGLESLGVPTTEIRARVAEMAAFFGIQSWFYKNVSELSGGQKQLLNLASIMVMQPKALILDEPTSQLDPIAAQEFLDTVAKINRELGTTVILTEHRLEEAFPMSDRVMVMDNGSVIAYGSPREVGDKLKDNDMFIAFPTPMRVHTKVKNSLPCPLTVKEGRNWLSEMSGKRKIADIILNEPLTADNPVIKVKDVWFRYEKDTADILKGMSLKVNKGELYAIVGGNGAGKTTAISVINGFLKPYRGKVTKTGKTVMLPQNPQTLFIKKTVMLDLMEMTDNADDIAEIAKVCEIEQLLQRHPYDLSGGEQQRAALAKVLLTGPDILLLDEPTKGLDAHFKVKFANIINNLKNKGITVIMVSHDIEFCAAYADRCGMYFDGNIVSEDTPKRFFSGKSFYTTAANRMARSIIPDAVLAEDIIYALGGDCDDN